MLVSALEFPLTSIVSSANIDTILLAQPSGRTPKMHEMKDLKIQR